MLKYFSFLLLLIITTAAHSQIGHSDKKATTQLTIQDLHWSPDGNSLLFSAMIGKSDWSDYKPEKWNVYEIQLKSKNIIKAASSALYGAYAPGQRYVAFSKMIGGNWEIVIEHVGTGDTSVLTRNTFNDMAPCFSPDRTQLVFMSDRDGAYELYTMSFDGSNQKRLTFSNGDKAYNPDWSPDGKSIVYYLEKGDSKDQIYTINLGNLQTVNHTQDDFNNIFPGWTRDGSIIYCAGKQNEKENIFRIEPISAVKQPVGNIKSFYARYSPDSYKIAYISTTEEGHTITIANALGLLPEQLFTCKDFIETFK